MPSIRFSITILLLVVVFTAPLTIRASELDKNVKSKVDSIQRLIESEKVDTLKFLHYTALNRLLQQNDRTAVVGSLEDQLALAKEIGDADKIALVNQSIGGNYLHLGQDSLAIGYVNESLEHFRAVNNLSRIAQNLNNLALLYQRSNRYEVAMETYQDVIMYSDSISDHAGKVYALINMMAYSKDQKDEARALKYVDNIEDIIDRFDEIPEGQVAEIKSLYAPIYLNAGLCCKDLAVKDTSYALFETAYEYFDKALEGLEYVNGDYARKYYRGYILNGKGETLYEEAKILEANPEVSDGLTSDMHQESFDYYKEAFDLFHAINVEREQAFSLVNQGKSLNELKKYSSAFGLLEDGLKRAVDLNFTEQIRDAYEQLKINSEKIGDYKSAYAYSEEWVNYKDKILYEDRINITKEFETKFELNKIEQDLKDEQHQRELEQQQADQAAKQRMFIYAFTMLLGLGLAYMFFARMRLNKQKEISNYQKDMNQAMSKFVPMAFINAIGSDKITSQYLGDGIMAIFQEDPTQALQACVDMQVDIEEYNTTLIAKGRQPISVGMGMHTGPLVMGIIGDDERWDATLISDTVNTAARIEQTTKTMNANILMSEYSANQMKEIQGQNLVHRGQAKIKGKNVPVEIYECRRSKTTKSKVPIEILTSS